VRLAELDILVGCLSCNFVGDEERKARQRWRILRFLCHRFESILTTMLRMCLDRYIVSEVIHIVVHDRRESFTMVHTAKASRARRPTTYEPAYESRMRLTILITNLNYFRAAQFKSRLPYYMMLLTY